MTNAEVESAAIALATADGKNWKSLGADDRIAYAQRVRERRNETVELFKQIAQAEENVWTLAFHMRLTRYHVGSRRYNHKRKALDAAKATYNALIEDLSISTLANYRAWRDSIL